MIDPDEIAKMAKEMQDTVAKLGDQDPMKAVGPIMKQAKAMQNQLMGNQEQPSMKNLGQMMKQAQEMQAKMTEMQTQLADAEIVGTSGGGLVEAKMSGKGELKGLKIDPSLVVAEEREVLEDLVVAAINDARTSVDAYMQEEMKKLTGGLSLPEGFKLPF